jgi:hypothetical protein
LIAVNQAQQRGVQRQNHDTGSSDRKTFAMKGCIDHNDPLLQIVYQGVILVQVPLMICSWGW